MHLQCVERFVEAAQTLDVFLAAHPVDTLSPDVAARVAAQRPAILSEVSSLTVTTDVPGTRVLINHQAVGTTPLVTLRLAPGTYDVEVAPEGGAPIQRVLDLAVGEHTETFSVATASPASAPPANDSAGCPAMPTKSGCSSTLSEFNAARDIEIVGYVGAGLGAATALVLYYLDSRRPHSRPESLGRVHVVCGVPGAGVACGGTF